MRIISKEEILSVIDIDEVIRAVREGFIDKDLGVIVNPAPMQILFQGKENKLYADCHVKAAQRKDGKYFVIKVASGFYQNKQADLPVNNGLSLLFCAQTGQPLALFNDGGYLTSLRTAAAGALSASLAKNHKNKIILGIIGTGHQARLQAEWINRYLNIEKVLILGKTPGGTKSFLSEIRHLEMNCSAVDSANELARKADVIVTTTPSTSPILMSADINKPIHIVAVGADSPGKQELDPNLLNRAEVVITDDHEQCLAHGEYGVAARANLLNSDSDIALGRVLSGETKNPISGNGISVVDLTGLGAQDLAIASNVWMKINKDTAC